MYLKVSLIYSLFCLGYIENFDTSTEEWLVDVLNVGILLDLQRDFEFWVYFGLVVYLRLKW